MGKRITIALGILALLPAIYVAAYFALVEVKATWGPRLLIPGYKCGAPVEFFAPIHEIDRKLRPGTWN